MKKTIPFKEKVINYLIRYPQNITLYYLVSCNLTQLLYIRIRIEVTRKKNNKKKIRYLFQNRQNNENPF